MASLARPSGVDIVVTGENTASFSASFQAQNVELESHTVGAGVADATGSGPLGLNPPTMARIQSVMRTRLRLTTPTPCCDTI